LKLFFNRALSKACLFSNKHWLRRSSHLLSSLLTSAPHTKERQLEKLETERGNTSEVESSMVTARSAISAVTDFLLQASGLGLDLETHRELGAIKALVISRYQRLRSEELSLALKNATSKEARRKINTDLKALQYTAASAPPLPPLEEIQSRVDALLVQLEERESDLLVDLNEGISSSLCDLSRQSFMQLVRHFECGLVLPLTADGSGVANTESLEREVAALERKNMALEQDLAALRRKQGVGLKVVRSSSPFISHVSLISSVLGASCSIGLSRWLIKDPHWRLSESLCGEWLTSPS
jgi:hypothetical protein